METASVGQQKMEFLNLLVTELKNQNPLEPLDNQQMAAQLAQFTQLEMTDEMNGNIKTMNETMGKMNSSFQGAMLVAEFDYAKSLLGKEVEFYNVGEDRFVTGSAERIGVDAATSEPVVVVREPASATETGEDIIHAVRLHEISGIRDF
jgi:flagellar hook assembly protein FlgD